MKRLILAMVPLAAVFFALISGGAAHAQVPGLTVTVPAGPPGVITATVNGQACGTATTSATATTTLTISPVCATAGSTITFTGPGGVALSDSLTVPVGGIGALALPSLNITSPITINVPAGPSGTITAHVNGQACGTATVTPGAISTISLPATCATPGATISFTGSGGTSLGSTLTIPASGGGTLTLPNLNATTPVTITLPPGIAGTITAYVNGQACGSATISATSSTTLTLPASCATAAGTITLSGAGGVQIAGTNLLVPASGGATLTVANLNSATIVTLPAGTGTLTFYVNGQACGSATLNAGASTTVTLPATCAALNGKLTFKNQIGTSLATELTLPASGSGVVTLTSLNPLVLIVVPQGPAGTITAHVNGEVCGSVTVNSTTVGTITLPASCAVPGATITFTGPNNVALSSNLTIGANGGSLTLPNLNAVTPLNVVIPAGGSGRLDIKVNGIICATVNLTGSAMNVALPATCMVPNATITFTGTGGNYPTAGEQLTATTTVPAAGTGTVTLVSFVSPSNPASVPGPAATGNGGYLGGAESGGLSGLVIALAALALGAATAGTTLVMRARR